MNAIPAPAAARFDTSARSARVLRRLDLELGITGLWQVLGRDDIPFEEMVGLDYLSLIHI